MSEPTPTSGKIRLNRGVPVSVPSTESAAELSVRWTDWKRLRRKIIQCKEAGNGDKYQVARGVLWGIAGSGAIAGFVAWCTDAKPIVYSIYLMTAVAGAIGAGILHMTDKDRAAQRVIVLTELIEEMDLVELSFTAPDRASDPKSMTEKK